MNRFIATPLSLAALAATAGCMSPPSNLDLALTRPSAESRYIVTLQPPPRPAAINQLHAWQVRLATPAGAPVAQARIRVDGGMPQHGHGLPTRPEVTRELPDGGYLVEGMKFSMTGWWEIKLAIDGPAGADRVTFNTVVVDPAPAR
ncbi:MAG: FixH family protein [Rubrivivax sp.]